MWYHQVQRLISITQLSCLAALTHVTYQGRGLHPVAFQRPKNSFDLICFQILSLTHVATLRYHCQSKLQTIAGTPEVRTQWSFRTNWMFFLFYISHQKIGTILTHVVLTTTYPYNRLLDWESGWTMLSVYGRVNQQLFYIQSLRLFLLVTPPHTYKYIKQRDLIVYPNSRPLV